MGDAERELTHRIVTDTTTVGLFQVDSQGRCTFMNPAAESITGYRFDEVKGQVLHDVLHGGRSDGSPFPLADCPVDSVAFDGAAIREHREEARRRDGSWFPALFSASPIIEGEQRVGAVIEIKDDSERVRSERARELFLGALGHDLRGALHAISLGSDLLLEVKSLDDARRRTVERMRHSIKRMDRLIEQALVLAQTLAGSVTLDRREMNLVDVVRGIINEMTERGVGRAIELQGPQGLRGVWDPDRLAQVVDNLVGNAVRHGEGIITITVADDDDAAVLSVHNHGPAIPDDALPILFDPFRRANRRSGGVGLGLYIVDQIVRAHGGTIDVASTPEAGTTFRVRLPREPDPQ